MGNKKEEYACMEDKSDKLVIEESIRGIYFEVKSKEENDEYLVLLNRGNIALLIRQLNNWLDK